MLVDIQFSVVPIFSGLRKIKGENAMIIQSESCSYISVASAMLCSAPGLELRLDMTLVSMLISRVNSRHDFEHDLRVSSRVEFRGDFRGELRGELRDETRGELRGEFRGENSEANSEATPGANSEAKREAKHHVSKVMPACTLVVKPYTQRHPIVKLNHFQSPLQFTNSTMDDGIEWFFHKRNV